MIELIEKHYPDIYPVCREEVFIAKLEGKPFPALTANLLPNAFDQLIEYYDAYDVYPPAAGADIYADKTVVWFAEYTDKNLLFPPDCLNIFFYRDQYKELR
jgi:hypothetical protein